MDKLIITAALTGAQQRVINEVEADLARGLPMGGDLEYADEATLARALGAARPQGRASKAPASK